MTTATGIGPSAEHQSRGETISLVVLSVVTVASLGFPLVTPLLALAGITLSIIALRRRSSVVAMVTLVVCALALITAGVIDLTLLSTGVQIGTPTPAAIP